MYKETDLSQYHRENAEQTRRLIEEQNIIDEGYIKNRALDEAEYYTAIEEARVNNNRTIRNKSEFLSSCKTALVTECLYKIYSKSFDTVLEGANKTLARNLITNFVTEQNASNLINRFKNSGDYMLSEMGRICSNTYESILEDCSDDDSHNGICRDFTVNSAIKDEFLKELEDIDTDDASQLIRDRVSDAVSDFVDSNMLEKLEYEEIINNAKDQMDSAKSEGAITQIKQQAQRAINTRKSHREKNIFHCMTESLMKSVFKDDKLKDIYMSGTTINMDKIVESTQLMYTLLEMVNTTNMVNVNEDYLNSFIESLSA